MPYAVTLRLNDKAAAPVERMWRALAEHSGDDDILRIGYAPHITLAGLPDSVPADAIEDAVLEMVNTWDALPIVLTGLGIFPGIPACSLGRAGGYTAIAHLTRQTALRSEVIGCPPALPARAWMSHVTLSQHGRSPAAHLVEAAASVWPGPISGEADRIDFVRFHPVNVLRSVALRPSEQSRITGSGRTLSSPGQFTVTRRLDR